MEVENTLFVEDFMVFQEAIVHVTMLVPGSVSGLKPKSSSASGK